MAIPHSISIIQLSRALSLIHPPTSLSCIHGGPTGAVFQLFVWYPNTDPDARNATLAHGDAEDRVYPDQVVIKLPDDDPSRAVKERFAPILYKDIAMARLHTGEHIGVANYS